MTDHEQLIDHLLKTPPQVQWTARQRIIVAAIWVLAMVGVVGVTVAIVKVGQVASCINTNLGQRSSPSQKDADAHVAYAQAVSMSQKAQNATSAALLKLLSAPKSEQAVDYTAFLAAFAHGQVVAKQTETATETYKTALSADQAQRNAHPLGKC